MALPIEYRNKIKEVLPHGTLNKVALKAGVSRNSVSNYLKGRCKDSVVEDILVEEYKNTILKIKANNLLFDE